ncbi:hypothetical protein D3C76_1358670 [compost metagenome]
MLNDHRRLLLIDQPNGFCDETLWIGTELCKHRDADTLEDVCRRASSQLRTFSDLADEVVLHRRVDRMHVLFGFGGLEHECLAIL